MEYKTIKEAIFLERPNRFIARVLVEGEEQTVHVKNTGRCKELLYPGVNVYLEDHGAEQLKRKTRYSLIAVEKVDPTRKNGVLLINIDSQAPNKAVREALTDGSILLPGMSSCLTQIKAEKTFAESRFDFYAEDQEGRKAYIEVKGVTLEEDGVVRFPDAPTERGVKHIKELEQALTQGFFTYLIFVIQMKGVSWFEPNDETHPEFGSALREAREKGVVLIACDCDVTENQMKIGTSVEIKL